MMKFNVYFRLRGPNGVVVVPNTTNPVEYENLASLLVALSIELPYTELLGLPSSPIRLIGVLIEEVEEHMTTEVQIKSPEQPEGE